MSVKSEKEKENKSVPLDEYEEDKYFFHLKKPNRTEKSDKRKILNNVSEDEWS